MTSFTRSRFLVPAITMLALALGAGASMAANAPIHCFPDSVLTFPRIALCAFPGRWQDSTTIQTYRCEGSFTGPQADSVVAASRTVTVRFKRDPRVEMRSDFGGYRIYRVIDQPDTSKMVLLRRYSQNVGDERTWHFSKVDTVPSSPTYMRFVCDGELASDSIVTFVDPDSSGQYEKRCHYLDPQGRCISPKDSILVLVPPSGPHDGFRTWYAVTYEAANLVESTYEDLFVPDTSDWSRCGTSGDPTTCPNLNTKSLNMTSTYLEPTSGPSANLESAAVVPNPYRAHAPWDPSGGNEVHFVHLPQHATIKVFTLAGDLVATLQHNDPIRDFERWNLKNGDGADVASGIYIYRVEAGSFTRQDRFIVIR